jgi:hypothetical protein
MKTMVFKRKNDTLETPMYQILLSFSNYTFQYIIPCFKKDKFLDGKTINLRSFMTPYDIGDYPYQKGSVLINLSNNTVVKDEIVPIDLHFERKEMKMDM